MVYPCHHLLCQVSPGVSLSYHLVPFVMIFLVSEVKFLPCHVTLILVRWLITLSCRFILLSNLHQGPHLVRFLYCLALGTRPWPSRSSRCPWLRRHTSSRWKRGRRTHWRTSSCPGPLQRLLVTEHLYIRPFALLPLSRQQVTQNVCNFFLSLTEHRKFWNKKQTVGRLNNEIKGPYLDAKHATGVTDLKARDWL